MNNLLNSEIQDVRRQYLWWQSAGLSYTASGYGKRIPTTVQIKVRNRWRRVYGVIYSNIGSCYIGKGGSIQYIDETHVYMLLDLKYKQTDKGQVK